MRQFRSLLAAAIIAVGIVVGFGLVARAWVRGRTPDEIIRVVGSARKPIRSDFIIWDATVSRNAPVVATAYAGLKIDADKVQKYLLAKGVAQKEIVPGAINVTTIYAKTKPVPGAQPYQNADPEDSAKAATFRPIVGYQLSQSIEVRSNNVDKIDDLSRQSTELISQGINFESGAPRYLYTKLSELKVTMQAEAAKDAHARAQAIAQSSNCKLGALRFARMSVPQITPQYSDEGDGGIDDTTALDKKITAIVSAGYAVN